MGAGMCLHAHRPCGRRPGNGDSRHKVLRLLLKIVGKHLLLCRTCPAKTRCQGMCLVPGPRALPAGKGMLSDLSMRCSAAL